MKNVVSSKYHKIKDFSTVFVFIQDPMVAVDGGGWWGLVVVVGGGWWWWLVVVVVLGGGGWWLWWLLVVAYTLSGPTTKKNTFLYVCLP